MINLHFDKIYSSPRLKEPAFISVPLPKGKLFDVNNISLVQNSHLLPFQSKATALHEDGSVKYLFIRFQSDLPANKGCDISLYVGEQPDVTDQVTPDDNCLSIDFANDCDHLFNSVKAFEHQFEGSVFEGPFITDYDGTLYRPSLGKWGCIESGDVCNIYEIKGQMLSSSDSSQNPTMEVRATLHAGKPWVDLSFRLINTTDKPLDIKDYSFEYKHFGAARSMVASSSYKTDFIINEEGDTVVKEVTSEGLLHENNEHFAEVIYGTFFGDVTDSEIGVTATVFQAHQNYPKAVIANKDGIIVKLVPENNDTHVILQSGMAVEQSIQLYFHGSETDKQDINNRSIIYQMPDRPLLHPLVYKDCGFLPDIFPVNKDFDAEEALMNCADNHARCFGMLNFGDAPDAGYTSQGRGNGGLVWTNNEYDYPYACMLMYYRTGIRRFLDYGIVAGRHQINVDVCHYSNDPLIYGGQWEHTLGHTINGEMVCSHQWVEGILACYHATGDERFYDTAVGIGDNILRLLDTPKYQENGGLSARETGWALRTLTALYTETKDTKWLAKSDWIVDQFKEWFDRYDGWLSPYTDNIVLRVPFMISIAVGSLMRYYREFPRNDIRVMIIKAVDDMIENCRLESGLFFYKEMPSMTRLNNNALPLEALAIAYELTKDKKYLDAGKRTYDRIVRNLSSIGGGGKKIQEGFLITGSTGTKTFAQAFIPLATYYTKYTR